MKNSLPICGNTKYKTCRGFFMFYNRVRIVRVTIAVLMIALIGRLFHLSILHYDDYSGRIQDQITQEVNIYYPRGKILDRNEIPLSGKSKLQNGIMLSYHKNSDIAHHVVGEVNYDPSDHTGNGAAGDTGLQKEFDQELRGGLPIKIVRYKDGRGQDISENGYYVYGDHVNQGRDIKTTLDYHIQGIIEEEMNLFYDEKKPKGIAVVVMDIEKGEVLGMASKGDENNKAVQSFAFGSIFKTLVAAKALEQGVVEFDEKFICNGSILIDDQLKHCHKTEGHGEITFKQAFAQSCNSVFYEVANRLTEYNPNGTIKGNQVLDLAQEFGLAPYSKAKPDSFILSDKYSKNTLPDSITTQMDVFNMALGQGKVEVSPLMATKIMATIANDGIMNEPILVREFLTQGGKSIEKLNGNVQKRVIDQQVNKQLQEMLEEVTISGTAQRLHASGNKVVAGKTGTAQNGSLSDHGWFSGYFPTNNPQYAMTVFVEEGGNSGRSAVPLFQDIYKRILDLGQRN